MFSIIKFFIAFSVSFVFLSIPIQSKPIFYYLNQWASPITSEIFTSSKKVLIEGVHETKVISKKMFNNTRPKQDHISVTSSSLDKMKDKPSNINNKVKEEIEGIKHSDEYTDEEKNMLNNILKNHQY